MADAWRLGIGIAVAALGTDVRGIAAAQTGRLDDGVLEAVLADLLDLLRGRRRRGRGHGDPLEADGGACVMP